MLVRTELSVEGGSGYQVTHTTADDVQTIHRVELRPSGVELRTMINPDGTKSVTEINPDDSRRVTAADGTVQTSTVGPDPRFGMQAPITTKSTVTTPGGTAATVTGARSVPSYGGNPLVFSTLTDTTTINSRPPSTSTYDSATRVTTDTSSAGRSTQTTVDTKGRVTRVQATGLHPLRVGYDTDGRPTTMKYGPDPDTAATRTSSIAYVDDIAIALEDYPPAAKGQVKSTTDAAGRTTTFEYDVKGRVSAQLLPDEAPLVRRVEFQYDLAGNLTSITPPGRPAHAFGYTPVNLEERYTPPQVTPPLADVETIYAYTPDRRLDLVTRPDGGIIDYAYDDAGRLETLTVDPASGPSQVHQYIYDDPGGPGDETGNLAQIVTPEATLEFSYDGGLPIGEAWSGTGLATASVTQHYDSSFRRDSQQVAIGAATEPAIAFSYDNDDLLTQAGALTLTRDPANGLLRGTSITSGSGTITDTIDYGTGPHFGAVGHYIAKHNGTPFFERVYERDVLGRITSIAETLTLPPSSAVVTSTYYEYDDADRLYRVCGDASCINIQAEYHYDANGNRTVDTVTAQGTVSAATYDEQDRLRSITVSPLPPASPLTTSYTYTDNGDVLTKTDPTGTTTYTSDALGNLRRVVLPDTSVIDYLVDGRNRRIGKKVNGILVQQWLYQDQLEPVAELDGSGAVVAEFVYGSKTHVPDYILKGGQIYRVVTDHLGSVELVVNVSDATVAQQISYDAFGRTTLDTSPGWQPFGYTGGIHDSDDPASLVPGTGLLRLGARDYQPTTGRWIQKDPIRFLSGDTNHYAYVFGNPIQNIDVTGLSSFDLNDLGNTLSEEERLAATQRYSLGRFLQIFNYNKGSAYRGGATHFFSATENTAIKQLFGSAARDAALQLHLIEQGILPPIAGLSKTTLYIYRLIAIAAITGSAGDPVTSQIARLKLIDALLRAM